MNTTAHKTWHNLSLVALVIGLVGLSAAVTIGCAASGEDPGTSDPALNPQPLPPVDEDSDDSKKGSADSSEESPALGGTNGSGGGSNGTAGSSNAPAERDAGTKAQPQAVPPCTLPGLC